MDYDDNQEKNRKDNSKNSSYMKYATIAGLCLATGIILNSVMNVLEKRGEQKKPRPIVRNRDNPNLPYIPPVIKGNPNDAKPQKSPSLENLDLGFTLADPKNKDMLEDLGDTISLVPQEIKNSNLPLEMIVGKGETEDLEIIQDRNKKVQVFKNGEIPKNPDMPFISYSKDKKVLAFGTIYDEDGPAIVFKQEREIAGLQIEKRDSLMLRVLKNPNRKKANSYVIIKSEDDKARIPKLKAIGYFQLNNGCYSFQNTGEINAKNRGWFLFPERFDKKQISGKATVPLRFNAFSYGENEQLQLVGGFIYFNNRNESGYVEPADWNPFTQRVHSGTKFDRKKYEPFDFSISKDAECNK